MTSVRNQMFCRSNPDVGALQYCHEELLHGLCPSVIRCACLNDIINEAVVYLNFYPLFYALHPQLPHKHHPSHTTPTTPPT